MARNLKLTGPSIGPPRWAADFRGRDHLIPGPSKVDAAQFPTNDAVTVTLTADAAAGDAVIVVTALTGGIKAGTVLYFGGAKIAILSEDAAAAETNLIVLPLGNPILTGDSTFVDGKGKKFIPSGTVVGRSLAERIAGTPYGVPADTDDDIKILAFDIADASVLDDAELYRPGSVVKENYLPNFGDLSAAVLAALRAQYVCIQGEG